MRHLDAILSDRGLPILVEHPITLSGNLGERGGEAGGTRRLNLVTESNFTNGVVLDCRGADTAMIIR